MNELFFFHCDLAYLGPGGAISAIGVFFAALLGIIITLLGFVWYPIRRILRKSRAKKTSKEPDESS